MIPARRVFVEKREGFRVEAESLRREFNENLSLNIRDLRLLNVYDIFGFTSGLLERCRYSVFGETVTDTVTDSFDLSGRKYLAVEYIPGQFDQRASSAVDCVHLIDPHADIRIRSARLLIFDDDMSDDDLISVRHYFINAVECREKDLSRLDFNGKADVKPMTLLDGFTDLKDNGLEPFCKAWGLAMNADDLRYVVNHFRSEGRNPTETELRILDTYWSDHCRHTTFTTNLTEITVDESFIRSEIEDCLESFHALRRELGREDSCLCLMELATIGARYLRKTGQLDDLEQSEENNACSIFVNIEVDGRPEQWLLQFKNETHNHPTEIEPFGGAATCLGGAIRDPLSGRAYVYQAMRVTGAGDIWEPVSETLQGKLPQKVISRKAASGYSSYGNQIGLATTHVKEIYHEGYTAKRLEIGAVVGAVKAGDVRRESPVPGDVILLLGGRTGRDGIGGATGSSKEHTEESLESCGSEVQKGNAPEERKIQRLFRRPEVTRLIKKSNDFGAGGVSVAIGELADGLDIYLDRVPVKYSGLNPTELAISESQERMAVVVDASDRDAFVSYCHQENIEVTYVADVTDRGRMRLYYRGDTVCDLSRSFIDSAGAPHYASACIGAVEDINPFASDLCGSTVRERMKALMRSPNVMLQKGLVEMFDATVGRSTVLMPFGGATQLTETQVSVQKLPVDGYTDAASMMAFGYNPFLTSWSPYHGAAYSVVEACTKIVAAGGDWHGMRFSFQEYFGRTSHDSHSWGKPLAALLGALKMQIALGLPSIGGKDSMSGSFENLNVPPTLVAFGITMVDASRVISPEFKNAGDRIFIIRHTPLANHMPDVDMLRRNWDYVYGAIASGCVKAAWSVASGGVAEALAKMSFGNGLGADVHLDEKELFDLSYGSIVLESSAALDYENAVEIGAVICSDLKINGETIPVSELAGVCEAGFSVVYPSRSVQRSFAQPDIGSGPGGSSVYPGPPVAHPVVYIPVFPGTNCDYDTAKAFRCAGAVVRRGIFRNLTPDDVNCSIEEMAREIDACHILALAGGFSAGDEPDGSGKFIASILCNGRISAAIDGLISRGGLILGICNGFQALVKSGLLPYGRTGTLNPDSPTLFRNDINRHISQMVTTRVASVSSPWLAGFTIGELHTIAVSHGEGKFVVNEKLARELFAAGQVAFQYVDNPNGSSYSIEGIISPNGQILGKMGHSERYERNLFKNITGNLEQKIFENATAYFRK